MRNAVDGFIWRKMTTARQLRLCERSVLRTGRHDAETFHEFINVFYQQAADGDRRLLRKPVAELVMVASHCDIQASEGYRA